MIKENQMKTLSESYKVRVTPEQSRQIQELLFALGGGWFGCPEQFIVQYTERPCFYVGSDGRIHANHSEAYFNDASFYSDCTEIQADDLIALLTDLSKSAENPPQGMELTPEFEAAEPVIADISVNTQDIGTNILDTNANIKDTPKFKVGDLVYFDLSGRIAVIDKLDGSNDFSINNSGISEGLMKSVCLATPENYEMLCKLYPHIKFEQPPTQADIDNEAVDKLAQAMKDKLAEKREQGYHGWETCKHSELVQLLINHVDKGDPIDVANFCAFLFARGEPLTEAVLDE